MHSQEQGGESMEGKLLRGNLKGSWGWGRLWLNVPEQVAEEGQGDCISTGGWLGKRDVPHTKGDQIVKVEGSQ